MNFRQAHANDRGQEMKSAKDKFKCHSHCSKSVNCSMTFTIFSTEFDFSKKNMKFSGKFDSMCRKGKGDWERNEQKK